MKAKQISAAEIVEAVLDGTMSTCAEFNRRVAELELDASSSLATDLHQVGHYLDDLDIRERDPEYAHDQLRAMREILSRLRI